MESEFQIGDRVRVTATAEVRKDWKYPHEDRNIKREAVRKPFEATVTGETMKREGRTVYYGEGEGSYFEPSKSVFVVLVRTHKRRREIAVFPEDLEKIA